MTTKKMVDDMMDGSRDRPYKLKLNRPLSIHELSELLQVIDIKIGSHDFENLSTTLKTQFKKDEE